MTPPGTPRAAIILVPLVAILISTRAAVLVQSRPNHNSPFTHTTNAPPHQSSNPTWPINPHAPTYRTRLLEHPTRRLVRGEERSPPVKSVLRQSGDNKAGDAIDDFFSSLQSTPSTPTPDEPHIAAPESTPEEVTEIQLEEQLQPSPFETGPVIVLDSENASKSEQGDDSGVEILAAVETDDEISPSPEVGEAVDGIGFVGTGGKAISTQEADFHIDSSAGKANQTPVEQVLEEDDPEASPSVTDIDSIAALPSDLDDSKTEESKSPPPTPSDASTNGSGEVAAPSMADSAPQNEASRVQVDLSVRSTSVTTVSQDFDTHVREYLASQTDTAPEDWKPVFVSAAEETKERGVTFFVWVLNYQGMLDVNGDVRRLAERIFSGGLETFLRSTLATDSISVQLFNEIQRDVQDKPPVTIEDIGTLSAEGQPTSIENAATGGELEGSESKSDLQGEGRKRNVWLVLGTCLGFVAVVGLCVTAFVVAKRSSNSPRHTLDGEEIVPPTLTSFHSMSTTDSTPSRFQTGAPVNPRGATMLRNQSRLLDWRAEQAAANDRESRVEILE